MPLRLLIIPDKFKGTLTARQAAEAIAQGWRESRPDDVIELLPMSDGGDGFGEVIAGLLPVAEQSVRTCTAAHEPHTGKWWWDESSKTAVIESAQIIGLALQAPGSFHPFDLDTFGLGAVFQAAAEKGARSCLVGIGGSATNDGGFGLARSLGWEFRDALGRPIENWTRLEALSSVHPPSLGVAVASRATGHLGFEETNGPSPCQAKDRPAVFDDLVIAVDVQNPLLGTNGASRIYGPQKGLRPEDFTLAERCLERLAMVVAQDLQIDCAAEPGAGAAGGLGFGLRVFLRGRFEPGFGVFARLARLEERLRLAQLVITGEGALDRSSLMGKGVGVVADLCAKRGIPCLGLAGSLESAPFSETARQLFTRAAGICPDLTTVEQAKEKPVFWLQKLSAEVAEEWSALIPNPEVARESR